MMDSASSAARPAALRTLPTTSSRRPHATGAFISPNNSATTTTTTTTAASAQPSVRARHVQWSDDDGNEEVRETSSALRSAPQASNAVAVTAQVDRLSQWAQRREAERRHAAAAAHTAHETSSAAAAPISLSKLLYDASSNSSGGRTAAQAGEPVQSHNGWVSGEANRLSSSPPATTENRHGSVMGMTPSGLADEVSVEEVEVVPAHQGGGVRTAHLSLTDALAEVADRDTNADDDDPHRAHQPEADQDEEDGASTITVEASAASESDVAERVLSSLLEKDKMIAALTASLRESEMERLALRQARDKWQSDAQGYERALAAATSQAREARATPPSSHRHTAPTNAISPGTHAATLSRLADLEAHAARLRETLATKDATAEALRHDVAASREKVLSLEQRNRQLQQQLAETQGEKREDVATLRAHIAQLQSQLDDRVRELKERERTHKRELVGLRKEMEALTAQFEAQLASVSKARALQESLTQAQQETQQVRDALARREREWEAKWQATQAQYEAVRREKSALIQSQDALVKAREAACQAVEDAEHELTGTRKELQNVRDAHAQLHEEVAALRVSLQRQSSTVAESTLQSTRAAERECELQQRIVALEASLKRAEHLVQQREADIAAQQAVAQQQMEALVSAETVKHVDVAAQVRECAASADKMEEAVIEAEARRRRAEAALQAAQEEVRTYKEKADRAAVQAQKDVLEHQELSTAMTAFHREKLNDALAALATHEAALSDAQAELATARQAHAELSASLAAAHASAEAAQQEAASLADVVARRTDELVEAKAQLKAALGKELALTVASRQAERRLSRYAAQHRAQTAAASQAARDQRAVWALVGELAALLCEDEEARQSSALPLPSSSAAAPAPTVRRSANVPARGGTTKTSATLPRAAAPVSLAELVQRAQAFHWWCVAYDEQVARDAASTAEDDELRSLSSRSTSSSRCASPEVEIVELTADGRSRSSVSSTSRGCPTPPTRERTKSPRSAGDKAGRAVLAAFPMPPLTAALEALRDPLVKLNHKSRALQQSLHASRADVATLKDQCTRAERRCADLEQRRSQARADADEASRAALFRAEVEHNKVLAAAEARWGRMMEERVREATQRSREVRMANEAAEKRVRLDRCRRVAEELVDFIARMPEELDKAQVPPLDSSRPLSGDRIRAPTTAVNNAPREGELLEPPRDELRLLCDEISHTVLGLEGGWDDLEQLCARQCSSANEADGDGQAERGDAQRVVPARANHTRRCRDWVWPAAMLADVEDALVDYLAARLHCAPTDDDDGDDDRRRGRRTTTAKPADHFAPEASEKLPPPLSLASGIRSWVQSLRRSDALDGRGGGVGPTRATVTAGSSEATPNLLLSQLLSTCLAYAVEHVAD